MCSDLPTGWDGRAVQGAAEETRLGAPGPRPQGRFTGQLQVSDALDSADITATYENGVLRLTIPMSQAAEPRRIELRAVDRQQPVAVKT
jgi:HSP20 family protein